MNLSRFLLVSACFMLSVPGMYAAENSPGFLGDSRPPRKIVVRNQNFLEIPPRGADNLEIVLGEKAFPITGNAAEELQKYLQKRLETTIPIVKTPTDGKISFVVGINSFSKSAEIDDSRLCRDAFIIQRKGRMIYILGKDDPKSGFRNANGRYAGISAQLYERGTLFGVYDFLERFGGIRFFWPGELGTVIPAGTPLRIPEIDIYDRPDFEARYYSVYNGYWEGDPPQTSPRGLHCSLAKNLLGYRNRLQTYEVPCGHGVILLRLKERFEKTHPEYFAQKKDGSRFLEGNGQLCLSSPVTRYITEGAEQLLQGKLPEGIQGPWPRRSTQREFFDHHYEDGFFPCECPLCQAHYSKGLQETSDFVWGTVVKTANTLKSKGIKGYVTMMAYWPYNQVPKLEIPDNVLVMVATIGPWGTLERNSLVPKWYHKLNRKVWLWNYSCKLGNLEMPDIPCLTPKATGNFYKKMSPFIYGSFLQTDVDKMIYNYLTYYLYGKIAWDNHADVDALLKDHYRSLFGPAAGTMEKIFNTFEEKWLRIAGKTVETPLGPQSMPTGEYELWNEIYSPKEIVRLENEFNTARKQAAGDKTVSERIQFIRKEFLEPIQNRAAMYTRKNDRTAAFAVPMKSADSGNIRKKTAVLSLQPWEHDLPLKSEVRLALDKDFLTVEFDMDEPEMDQVTASSRKQDDLSMWEDNGVEIFLDPEGTRKSYCHIIINSKGSVYDMKNVVRGPAPAKDLSWDSDTDVRVENRPGGWKATAVFPLKNLPEFNKNGFTANFGRNRVVRSKSTLFSWSSFLTRSFHEPEAFGTLIPDGCPAENLVRDGDFQVEMKPNQRFGAWSSFWTLPKGVSVDLDKSTFIFGDRSLRLGYSGNTVVRGFAASQSLPAMKPNTKYRISYFLKMKDVTPLQKVGRPGVTVNVWSSDNHFFPRVPWTGTHDWLFESYEFKSGPKTNTDPKNPAYIMLWLGGASGQVWFDGVRLQELPEKKDQ